MENLHLLSDVMCIVKCVISSKKCLIGVSFIEIWILLSVC